MSAEIGAWVLSVAGVITLTVLLDILLPEGQMNKYVKGICSVVTIFVIISPLPAFIGKDYRAGLSGFGGDGAAEIETDGRFLEEFYQSERKRTEKVLADYLAANGFKVGAEIVAPEGIYTNIEKVYIFSVDGGMSNDNVHIHMNEIRELTARRLSIEEKLVVERTG
ncbi:MAG: stage III sporulation protein AF [Clostridiaceae bacterium]|jgi:stage III sporulation protein AF|nr:stage III sporulation protein AF [Clostridiaceae bacterium]